MIYPLLSLTQNPQELLYGFPFDAPLVLTLTQPVPGGFQMTLATLTGGL